MTELSSDWIMFASTFLSVLLGAIGLALVYWVLATKKSMSVPLLGLAAIAAFLVTIPKWTNIAVKWGDAQATIAELQKLKKENDDLQNQKAAMTAKTQKLEADFNSLQAKLAYTEKNSANLQFQVDGVLKSLDRAGQLNSKIAQRPNSLDTMTLDMLNSEILSAKGLLLSFQQSLEQASFAAPQQKDN